MLQEESKGGDTLPSLDEILNFQNAEGFFLEDSEQLLFKFLDAKSQELVRKLFSKNDKKLILTLVAMVILNNKFEREKKEWKMVAQKAKEWSKTCEHFAEIDKEIKQEVALA